MVDRVILTRRTESRRSCNCAIVMQDRVARAITTIAQMLSDRGDINTKLAALGSADIDNMVQEAVQGVIRVDTGSRDVLFFIQKIKSSDLVKAAADTSEQRVASVMIVTIEPFKKTQKTAATGAFGPHYEVFTLDELSINISRHMLVPRHELVPSEHIPELQKQTMVSRISQLPIIKRDDAMAKYIRARPGDVVQVTRTCPTVGTQVAYRYCAYAVCLSVR